MNVSALYLAKGHIFCFCSLLPQHSSSPLLLVFDLIVIRDEKSEVTYEFHLTYQQKATILLLIVVVKIGLFTRVLHRDFFGIEYFCNTKVSSNAEVFFKQYIEQRIKFSIKKVPFQIWIRLDHRINTSELRKTRQIPKNRDSFNLEEFILGPNLT